MLTHLDLFSGIGGFALACQWAGIETIGFVEIDKYCQKVLQKHWPDVPIVEDIRDVKEITTNSSQLYEYASYDKRAEGKAQIPEPRDNSSKRGVLSRRSGNRRNQGEDKNETRHPAILVTAGFPCQPFSVAGKRGGETDDRYLWPETLAVIEAVKPKWVLLENVAGIINLALDTVLSDLEGAGYSWEALVIPACAVNAWHRRDRIWIVANTTDTRSGQCMHINRIRQTINEGWDRFPQSKLGKGSQDVPDPSSNRTGERYNRNTVTRDNREIYEWGNSKDTEDEGTHIDYSNQNVPHASSQGLLGSAFTTFGLILSQVGASPGGESSRGMPETRGYWAIEPQLGRVAHGIPHRVDRLRCLGNAIVPQVAYEIIKAIVEIDKLIPHKG